MYTTLRPYATAGVAMLGASAIAIAPVVVTPTLPDLKVVSTGVQLNAAIDPLTPLLELFNSSEVNVAALVDAWLEAPAPILQQIIANQIGYLGQLPDIGAILAQMGTNLVAGLRSPFAEDPSTLEPLHASIYELIVDGIPGAIEPAPPQLVPLLEFTTTYLSGVLVGLAGLVMNPVLALGGGIHSVFQSLIGEDADLGAAINTLINIPTAMADAFLNGGQSMVVTPLLTALGLELPIPGMEVELNFGGLLSPGGSMFNSLNLVFGPGDELPGQGAGLIGSLVALSKVIAKAIGWDGEGNPLAPPLTPQSTLREATDTSLASVSTVTLETGTAAVVDAAEDAESASGGSAPESSTAPAVSEDQDGEGVAEEDDTAAYDEAVKDEVETVEEEVEEVAEEAEEVEEAEVADTDVETETETETEKTEAEKTEKTEAEKTETESGTDAGAE
ncbi:hypothetical protein [Mycolicibacterium gilvum]|uniref:PE-PGRS family protein n=2 Tax=Mycolicibacterium gilvum TaxID=1804 RepID=E6TG27_MYCSR|nr:hypothetical protein [Mycolicibacterium gilvum]ABP44233.1 conserved hypothetical protein [Mycolicibacterium gilvum PYR-GCK]ADT97820.1 hypothetical protein Mspyr1_11370 [Mycolicibacterium gilvum Spyr1]